MIYVLLYVLIKLNSTFYEEQSTDEWTQQSSRCRNCGIIIDQSIKYHYEWKSTPSTVTPMNSVRRY